MGGCLCRKVYSILFYSILFCSILFYSVLFYSILLVSILLSALPRGASTFERRAEARVESGIDWYVLTALVHHDGRDQQEPREASLTSNSRLRRQRNVATAFLE